MSTEKTDAIVIRLADFSESSRVVTFFTRDFGKVAVLAKGAKRLKGAFEAALDLLTACRIVFIRKTNASLGILTEAQLVQRFRPDRSQLAALYAGYYVAELLDSLTQEFDAHPQLFDDSFLTIEELTGEQPASLTIARFELTILREIGELPELSRCIVCDNEITESESVSYWAAQSGVLCHRCRRDEYSRFRLHGSTLSFLRELSNPSAPGKSLQPTRQQLAEIRHVLSPAISHILGRQPRTLKYLQL